MIAEVLSAALLAMGQSIVVNPSWATAPSYEYVDEPYPPFANLIGVNARVVVHCRTLARAAAPQGCEIISTSVSGMGFEAKALEIAATGIVSPRQVDGVPQPSTISFGIPFTVDGWKPSKQSYVGPAPSDAAVELAERMVEQFGSPYGELGQFSEYAELEPVRRARVAAWIKALLPPDIEDKRRQAMLTIIARLYSEDEMTAALKAGLPPSRSITAAEFAKVTVDLDEEWDQAAVDTLRTRYCAEYDCGE